MKNILFVFVVIFIRTLASAQEIPEKANTIVISVADSASARQKIMKVLSDKDYTVKNSAKTPSIIFTDPKTIKNGRISLHADIKGKEVLLTGLIVIAAQGNMKIEYKGKKGTPLFIAWEEMDKVAKAIGPNVKYEVR